MALTFLASRVHLYFVMQFCWGRFQSINKSLLRHPNAFRRDRYEMLWQKARTHHMKSVVRSLLWLRLDPPDG